MRAKSYSIVGSVQDLRTGGRWFDTRARPIPFPRIDDSHCDRIHFLTAVHCFGNGYVGKQSVRSTGKKSSRKAWMGALADAI